MSLGSRKDSNIVGFIGTELAAEIKVVYPDKHVTLIEANQKLVKKCSPKTCQIAQSSLEGMGVKIEFGQRIVDYDAIKKRYTSNTGKTYDAEVIYWCTGPTPNTEILKEHLSGLLDEQKYVKVCV